MSELTDLDNWRAAGAEFIATMIFGKPEAAASED